MYSNKASSCIYLAAIVYFGIAGAIEYIKFRNTIQSMEQTGSTTTVYYKQGKVDIEYGPWGSIKEVRREIDMPDVEEIKAALKSK